jgi:hypothetical protein
MGRRRKGYEELDDRPRERERRRTASGLAASSSRTHGDTTGTGTSGDPGGGRLQPTPEAASESEVNSYYTESEEEVLTPAQAEARRRDLASRRLAMRVMGADPAAVGVAQPPGRRRKVRTRIIVARPAEGMIIGGGLGHGEPGTGTGTGTGTGSGRGPGS